MSNTCSAGVSPARKSDQKNDAGETPALQVERSRLKLLAALAAAFATTPFLPACSRDPGHGPGEVHWDRDTCKRCGMAVSDRHYAAQIRGGPKREVFKFDDIGCALFWLQEQKIPWVDAPETEIWVTDFRTGEWLEARKAHYLSGKTTPMAYGFAATAQPEAGSIDYTAMRAALLAKGK